MSHFEYKLQQLTNFLGEKKLKQLGLLTCETCNHIMAHAEGLVPPTDFSNRTYLTPNELADINKQLYDSALPTSTTSYLSFPEEVIENPEADSINETDKVEIINKTTEMVNSTEDTGPIISSSKESSPSKPIKTRSPYPAPPKTAEQLLAEILLDITTAHPPKDIDLGMGYIYNIYPPSPPHALACTECNRLYAIAHPVLQLMPLPVRLTSTEYELLKGVYVDILL